MKENNRLTVRLSTDKMATILSYAKELEVTKSEALIFLLDQGLANLTRAEELKNLVDRRIDRIDKKQEFEAKRGLEILKKQAVNEALLEKVLQMINVKDEEITQLKNGAISRFISDLKGGKND